MRTYQRLFVFVFCVFAQLTTGCTGKVELLQGVSETEANEALAALLESGINASKLPGKEGTVGIEVQSSEVARAISILRAEGLPKERYAKMGEVFRKEGLISSPLEERARYLWALSQELSATISQIDGVIKARVHVVLPERGSSGDPMLPSSAAVFIKHKSGINLDDSIPQVKRLVTNSIPGLAPDKVTVISLPSLKPASSAENITDQVAQVTTSPSPEKISSATLSATSSDTALHLRVFGFELWLLLIMLLVALVVLAISVYVIQKKFEFLRNFRFSKKQIAPAIRSQDA